MNIEFLKKILGPNGDTDEKLNARISIAKDFPPDLYAAFDSFTETGILPEFEYKGWTIEKIMKHVGCDEFSAFRKMKALMLDPEYLECFGKIRFWRK